MDNLEKARSKKRIITSLRKESGEMITEEVSYYSKVYSQSTAASDVKEATDTSGWKKTRLFDAKEWCCYKKPLRHEL